MRVAILGAGGLGSVVGGRLAQSGVDVWLVARTAHAEAIRKSGLLIGGISGDARIRENLTAVDHPTKLQGDFDYLIVGVKGKDTETILDAADAAPCRIQAALSLQNSIEKDELLAKHYGEDRVLGCAIIDGGLLVEPGKVIHTVSAPITVYIGELNGAISSRVSALVDALNTAGLGARATESIVQVEWEKLAQICTASSFAVSTFGTLEVNVIDAWSVEPGAQHYVTLAREILSVYQAMGYEVQDFFAPLSRLRDMVDLPFDKAVQVTREMAEKIRIAASGGVVRTSMHEDMLRRRLTEADTIIGPFLRKASTYGIEVPTLTGAYRVIKTVEHLISAR